jgi:hypothetical protein
VGVLLAVAGCQGDAAYLGSAQTPYSCVDHCQIEQDAPSDAGDWFANPESQLGDAPRVVYPLADSIHPKDLSQLTVQFRRGRSDFSLFRLRIAARDGSVAYDFFTRCLVVDGDGCRYLLQGDTWNAARDELEDVPVVLTVTGATARRGVIKTSEPLEMLIAPSELQNKGFYYWTSVPIYSGDEPGTATGIFRLPFGADRAEPFIMPGTATNERDCGACHSVSRDGSTIAFTARNENDSGADQRSGVLVTSRTTRPESPLVQPPMDSTYDSSMMALSSTGQYVLVAYDDRLVLRSATDASATPLAMLTKADLDEKIAYFPEFSRDDDAVVVTLSDTPDSAIAVQSGDIAVIDVDLAGRSFGAPRIVVNGTDDEFHFYPTWSPDQKYIAFASAPRGLDDNGLVRKSYDQRHARLRLVSRDGSELYDLANATHLSDSWSTFPKFAPFQSKGGLMFLTFNSKINYGLLLDNESKPSDQDRLAQLWMSAIDVSKLPDDPSSPPVWLPFQDASQSSHLGIWTDDVKCRTDVGGSGCPIGQRCSASGNCVVVVQ